MSVAGETLPPFALSVTFTVVGGGGASVRIARLCHVPAATAASQLELSAGTIVTRSLGESPTSPQYIERLPSTSGRLPRNFTVLRFAHLENAPSPMLVTVAGIVTLAKAPPQNAYLPMLLTPDGIVKLVSGQLSNALSPMLLTLSGIVTVASAEQLKNAVAPITDTPCGIVTFVSPEHCSNACSPIVVTLDGIVTLFISDWL